VVLPQMAKRQGFTDCLIQEMKSNWTDIAFFFIIIIFFLGGEGLHRHSLL
jgi:hypothetical protein